MRRNSAGAMLAVAAALMLVCGGCRTQTVHTGEEVRAPVTDACSERLHALSEHLLTYHLRHGSMPGALADLTDAGVDPALVTCPASGKAYSYRAAAAAAVGMGEAVLVWDSEPVHGGRRHAIVIERRGARQPIVLNVIDLPVGWAPVSSQKGR